MEGGLGVMIGWRRLETPLSAPNVVRSQCQVGVGVRRSCSSPAVLHDDLLCRGVMIGHLQDLLFWLLLLWAALYAFRHYRRRRTSHPTFLPGPTSSTKFLSPEIFRTRTTRVTLSNLHLGVQSTACNDAHQSLAARLKRSRWRRPLGLAYDAGSLSGVLGMLGSILLLLWTTLHLVSSVHVSKASVSTTSRALYKRQDFIGEGSLSPESSSRDAPLQLIVSTGC